MNRFASRLIVLVTAAACSGGAAAQNVVRCGNAYGEQSCPGGRVVPADDPRTPAQRAQAEAVLSRDARMAQALEAARLRAEQDALSAARKHPPSASGARPQERKPPSTRKTGLDRPFTAVAPAPAKETRQGAAANRKGAKPKGKRAPAKASGSLERQG